MYLYAQITRKTSSCILHFYKSMSMDGHDQQNSSVKPNGAIATIGFLSAALGFAAEATKLQLAEVKEMDGPGCTYPSHSGPGVLAIIAVVALLGFRVYCPGARSPSSAAQLARYLSWLAWLVAMIFYVVGLLMIKNQGAKLEYRYHYESYYKCNVVKPGIFGAGASFALTSIVLEIVYLVVTQHHTDKTKTVSDPTSDKPSVVAMC